MIAQLLSKETEKEQVHKMCLRYVRDLDSDIRKVELEGLKFWIQFYQDYKQPLRAISIDDVSTLSAIMYSYSMSVSSEKPKGRRKRTNTENILSLIKKKPIVSITLRPATGHSPKPITNPTIIRAALKAIENAAKIVSILEPTRTKGRPVEGVYEVGKFWSDHIRKLTRKSGLTYEFLWSCFHHVSPSHTPLLDAFQKHFPDAVVIRKRKKVQRKKG